MILIAQQESLPRSVPFLNASIYMLLLCLPRFIYRYVHDQHARQKQRVLSDQAVPVLLAGSSESTELFILKIIHSPALSYHPLAILSPSNAEKGRTVHSVPIIGTPFQWKKAVKKLDGYDKKPTAIIITDHLVSDAFLEAISYIAQTENYALMKMIPNFTVMPTQTDGAPATVISSSIKA
jgi:O-antigen biosynthesis protein WbqV